MRQDRKFNELRPISFETNINLHAGGSCLVKFGNPHVICTASIDEKVPYWLRNSGRGWVTAEYGMLPMSTSTRIDREAVKGRQSGRTQEIQRIIGRSLRAVVNLENIGSIFADGARAFVGGGAIIGQQDVRIAISEFRDEVLKSRRGTLLDKANELGGIDLVNKWIGLHVIGEKQEQIKKIAKEAGYI